MSFPVRKLLINNFKSFGKAIIEFERYTVFVTFGEKCVGLIDIIETLQFVLCHNYKLKPKDIRKLTTPGMAKPERTFVKVQVFEDNISYTFERAVNDNAFEYLYNDVEVTLEIYMSRLSDLGLTDCTATMFVNLDVLNTYVSFTDKDRCRMIETLCGSINEKPLFDKLNNKLQMNKKELNIVMQRHKYLTAQRNELKKRVYGRVSDFTRSTNAFLHDALKCRFGSSYQAIVVDTKETAHDCISLMKKLKLTEHNETFLFLSGLKLQDTEKFMIDKEGVKHIQFEYIENVLSNITDSIKDALISCASKTVFCKSYDDAVKVFDLEKNNVNVVSTDDQLLFERSGFITKGSKESEFEISDAIFNDFRIKKLEAEEKLRVLLSEQTKSKTMIMSLISLTEKKLINIIEEIDNASKEVDIIDETIDTLTDKLTALKNQEGNHPTAEDEFFADFCKYLKIPNIKEYRQRMLNPTAAWSTVLDGINDRLYDYKKELDISKYY
ncbi:unnamed protein product [Diamesa serratosioi]